MGQLARKSLSALRLWVSRRLRFVPRLSCSVHSYAAAVLGWKEYRQSLPTDLQFEFENIRYVLNRSAAPPGHPAPAQGWLSSLNRAPGVQSAQPTVGTGFPDSSQRHGTRTGSKRRFAPARRELWARGRQGATCHEVRRHA